MVSSRAYIFGMGGVDEGTLFAILLLVLKARTRMSAYLVVFVSSPSFCPPSQYLYFCLGRLPLMTSTCTTPNRASGRAVDICYSINHQFILTEGTHLYHISFCPSLLPSFPHSLHPLPPSPPPPS